MARRKPELLDQKGLMDYAVRSLTMRALSASELRVRLQRRALAEPDVDEVISKLTAAKALDDRRFAEYYASARLQDQGFGKLRVLRDLRQRRVSGELAESVVQQTFDGTDELVLIDQFLSRKYRKIDLAQYLSEDKHLMSAFRRLRLAGFSAGSSIKVLKRYAAKADALEDTGDDAPA